ncbi:MULTISPECIES: hypothetical protein [Amycolatopsis]|uniref:Integral membrane protein n=1 Tax=Amycolatopsis bullii TaxID=941987 RepID=A0ABQ3KLS7_9PSEU|nr:hypothetical protein [Amycolatopsis bullii]GHG33969.1 hypothetical protein GCM10017567_62830 [Amycolatopsis bullii]
MPTEGWIGSGGAVLAVAALFAQHKASRKWAKLTAAAFAGVGWVLAAHLLTWLVPGVVVGWLVIGGSTLGIFLTALIGGRSGRSSRPDRTDPPPTARDDRRPTTDL